MANQNGKNNDIDQAALDEMVASTDSGARSPAGPVGAALGWTAFAWAVFQLWIASPLPFMFAFGVFNDTKPLI